MAEVLNYSAGQPGVIIAKASGDYRWRRYVLFLVIFGWGIWSIHDGFFKYPRENQAFLSDPANKGRMYVPHPGLDVQLNQWLGCLMPPLSLVFLGWIFFNSRGQYEYNGVNLNVPGHPPIPVSAITKIDKSKWDRKGIAYLHYQLTDNTAGAARLDDFIYDRVPTDEIYKHITDRLESGETPPETVPVEQPPA